MPSQAEPSHCSSSNESGTCGRSRSWGTRQCVKCNRCHVCPITHVREFSGQGRYRPLATNAPAMCDQRQMRRQAERLVALKDVDDLDADVASRAISRHRKREPRVDSHSSIRDDIAGTERPNPSASSSSNSSASRRRPTAARWRNSTSTPGSIALRPRTPSARRPAVTSVATQGGLPCACADAWRAPAGRRRRRRCRSRRGARTRSSARWATTRGKGRGRPGGSPSRSPG